MIIISAKGTTQNKIDLLRLGADDYITKPFDMEETLARIESNLRNKMKAICPNEEYIDTVWGIGYRLHQD